MIQLKLLYNEREDPEDWLYDPHNKPLPPPQEVIDEWIRKTPSGSSIDELLAQVVAPYQVFQPQSSTAGQPDTEPLFDINEISMQLSPQPSSSTKRSPEEEEVIT